MHEKNKLRGSSLTPSDSPSRSTTQNRKTHNPAAPNANAQEDALIFPNYEQDGVPSYTFRPVSCERARLARHTLLGAALLWAFVD